MEDEYYKFSIKETLKKVESNKDGLTSEEAKVRLNKNGYNKLKEAKKKGILLKILEQFKDVMLIVLIISAILSAFVSYKTNEPMTDTFIILFVVLLNAILGVIQESKAEKAIEALKNMSLPYIKVKRDGKVESIKTEELVVGDVVLIEAGDSIPADMRIIQNHSLRVEEAALTGESVPVDKSADAIKVKSKVSLADRNNMLYSGSNVVYGRGEAVVVATGMNTELGKIASALATQKPEITPLQKKMNQLSKVLSIVVVVIAVIMFIVGYFIQKNDILDVFMLAISLAVAAIPEGLSAVITITLAMGVQKMASQKAIVRKLSSVEALGATEVICSDKTGTLTQNKMTLRKIFLNNNIIDVSQVKKGENFGEIKTNEFDILTKVYSLCNDTKFGEEGGKKVLLGDPTETCLIEFADKLGYDKEKMDNDYVRVDELPFDSTRKMMTTVNEYEDDKYIECTKGAVESVISNCDTILIDGSPVPLTDSIKKEILNNNISMAKEALRVLACAYKIYDRKDGIIKDEKQLTFVGLVGMIDPPRKEAKRAVERCFNAGMIPVMITGDNKDTAVAIAKEIGIIRENEEAVTGIEVDNMTDDELYNRVENIRVYARVSPENKIRIVKAWKKHGKTVAMTGDGVNDAPALKGADIGVGMGITGTEVSKSVSSMVLADDNFATIVVAIKEGRRIYNNIQNVIAYLLASNLAEIIIIFVATLFNKVVLAPIQILWINLITDTIPAIALGFEKEEKDIMRQKPRNANENIFTPFLILRIVIPAIIKSVAILIIYLLSSKTYGVEVACGAVFVTLAFIEILFSSVCRSDKKTLAKIGLFSNKPMFICTVATIALQSVIMFVPALGSLLKVPTMPTSIFIDIILICVGCFALFEIVKVMLAKIFIKSKNK